MRAEQKRMTSDARSAYIKECLLESGTVSIASLTAAMNVSEMTARRDLARLEEEGYLIRTHGGARRLAPQRQEFRQDHRLLENRAVKEKIGAYAAQFVENGDIIILDASTTTRYMVQYLLNKKITVITNQIDVATAFLESKTAEVILLGGKLRKSSNSLTGYDVLSTIKKYNVDKIFCSSKALDERHGLTDVTVEEGEVKRALIQAAAECYLLMDDSKLDMTAFYHVVSIDKIDHIITNCRPEDGVHQEFWNMCKRHDMKIHFCTDDSSRTAK